MGLVLIYRLRERQSEWLSKNCYRNLTRRKPIQRGYVEMVDEAGESDGLVSSGVTDKGIAV